MNKHLKEYFIICLGCIIAAFGISVFLVPYKIAPGGVTGISTVIFYLSGEKMPVGITMLLINIPLFFIGYKTIGARFLIRTVTGTVILSAAIDLIEPYSYLFSEILVWDLKWEYSHDLLLYSLFGGFLMGIGLGMVIKSGATTGGTDLAAKLLSRYFPSFTIGQALIIIDFFAIVFAAVVFQSLLLAMYAVVSMLVASGIIDHIAEGFNYAKALYIISDKQEIIAARILKEIDRGVTGIKAKGMYTGEDKQVLFCVVNRSQIPAVKQIVGSIDERAFVILTDAREVLGEGFKKHGS